MRIDNVEGAKFGPVKRFLLVNPGTLVRWTDCRDMTLSVFKMMNLTNIHVWGGLVKGKWAYIQTRRPFLSIKHLIIAQEMAQYMYMKPHCLSLSLATIYQSHTTRTSLKQAKTIM